MIFFSIFGSKKEPDMNLLGYFFIIFKAILAILLKICLKITLFID